MSEPMSLEAWWMQHVQNVISGNADGLTEALDTDAKVSALAWEARQPEIDAIKARNAELERDAARYRFIRDVPYTPKIQNIMDYQLNAVMDAAIDEALKGQS